MYDYNLHNTAWLYAIGGADLIGLEILMDFIHLS